MSSLVKMMRRCYSTARDAELIQTLRSELKHEQSSHLFKGHKGGSLGNFELSWDDNRHKDVILRRKCDSGEEIAVSALLGPFNNGGENSFPFKALMKICIKKPEWSSLLLFDGVVVNKGFGLSEFSIQGAHYLPSQSCLEDSKYTGPAFSDLDPEFQASLKEYLGYKGIGDDLTNFLILHLHKKENDQYVNWLGRLESFLSKDESANPQTEHA